MNTLKSIVLSRPSSCLLAFATLLTFIILAYASYNMSALQYSPREPDVLFLEQFYTDVVLHNNSIKDWSLPNAPSYIDIALYSVLRSASTSLDSAMAAHAALSVSAFSLGVLLLFLTLPISTNNRLWIAISIPASLTIIIATPIINSPFLTAHIPLYHFLTAILAVACGSLTLRFLQSSDKKKQLITTSVAIFLTSMSDQIFVIWLIGPAVCIILLCKQISIRSRASYSLVFLSTSLFGIILGQFFRPTTITQLDGIVNLSIGNVARSFETVFSNYTALTSAAPALVQFVLLCGYFGTLCAAYQAFSKKDTLSSYYLVTLACTTLGVALNGKTETRYLIPVYFLPPTLGTALFMHYLLSSPSSLIRNFTKSIPLMLFLGGLVTALQSNSWNAPHPTPIDIVLKKIADQGFTKGATTYQFARTLQFAPGSKVELTPIFHNARPYRPNTTQRLFRQPISFFILPISADITISESEITAINGPPSDRILTDNFNILLYPKGARLATNADVFFPESPLSALLAENDYTLWSGHILMIPPDISLRAIRIARREYETNYVAMIFSGSLTKALGSTITFAFAGDHTPWHKKKAAAHISATGTSALDNFLRLFLHTRSTIISQETANPLSNGGFIVAFPLPNRHIQKIHMAFVTINNSVYRVDIKQH